MDIDHLTSTGSATKPTAKEFRNSTEWNLSYQLFISHKHNEDASLPEIDPFDPNLFFSFGKPFKHNQMH